MVEKAKNHTDYVEQVHASTKLYIDRLLGRNEELARLATRLEMERSLLERRLEDAEAQLARYSTNENELKRRYEEAQLDHRRIFEEYARVEEQNTNLANLYVATYRLHGTVARREVLTAIRDVVVNLIGSEEIAVFEIDPERTALTLVDSLGINAAEMASIPLGEGVIGRSAESGDPYLEDSEGADGRLSYEADLTACIPLAVEGRVTGALAVFRLLEQKAGLERTDRELFELLGSQAGLALYCTKLHEQFAGVLGVGS